MPPTLAVMGRPKKSEPTEPLRIPESVVKRIRRIASHRQQDASDYVAERFGPLLDLDENEMQEDIKREQEERKSGAPKPAKKKPKK